MPQGFLTLRAVARPFTLHQGGGIASYVTVDSPAVPVWSDGTIDTTWTPPLLLASAYGGTTIDTSTLNWLVIAIKGAAAPVLLKEADIPQADTVLGVGTWGLLARVDGASVEKMPQA